MHGDRALQAVSYTLFEAAVMAHSQTHGVDYGFQRAWGTLAVIVSSFLSGYLVTLTGTFRWDEKLRPNIDTKLQKLS